MMHYVQKMMVTTIAILLLVTVTTFASGNGIHQEQKTHAAHHRHQYKRALHQDTNQRFDEPLSGRKTPELFQSKRLIANSKSIREDAHHQANDDAKDFLHPDKKWDHNSTRKYEDRVSLKLTKKEPSLDSGKSSEVDHELSGEAQYVPPLGEVVSSVHRRPKLTRTIPYHLENGDDVANIRGKAQTEPALNKHLHQNSPDALQGTKRAYTSDLEGAPCTSDADCYLQNFNCTFNYKGPVVHEPFCQVLDNTSSEGYCTCGEYCVSRSKDSADDHIFYYCGPCGRMGSSCSASTSCNHSLSSCSDGYCSCDSGEFYDLYYCMIPYYGYEKALQVAIATCIFVAVCLLAATIYSALYRRQPGRVHPYLLRLLMRRANQGTRESPPGDTPPKYDDVVEEPPSYQQALELERGTDGQEGEDNPAFDGDNKESNNTQDKDRVNDENKLKNHGGDGSGGIVNINVRDTSNNIGRDNRVPDEGITISVVATKSSSDDINSNRDGDNNNNNSIRDEADDSVTDEYARHVARHTGAIPKQRSLANIKQRKMKRANQPHPKRAPGVGEEGCLSSQAVSRSSRDDAAVSGDGRGSCSVDNGDDIAVNSGDGRDSCSVDNGDDIAVNSVARDTCSVDSKGMGAPIAQQPITLPLQQHKASSRSTQF